MDKTITAICTYTYSDEPVTMVFTGDDNLLQLSFQLIEADSINELKTIKISGNGQGSAYNEALDEGLLDGAENLISVDLTELNTSNVTNMRNMFYDCYSLTELDLSNFDTSNVTDMYSMFNSCRSLTSLDLSNFDTSNVTNMDCMFAWCSNLTSVDLSHFITARVTAMENMFYNCSNLTELDLRSFDTTRVNYTSHMFYNCSKLETIYNNNDWDSPNINSSAEMFKNCYELFGAIAYNQNSVDITRANSKTGYFTNNIAAKVIFRRKKTAETNNLPIRDGQLIYDTETGKTYLDNGSQRIATGRDSGDTVPIGAIIEYDGDSAPSGYEEVAPLEILTGTYPIIPRLAETNQIKEVVAQCYRLKNNLLEFYPLKQGYGRKYVLSVCYVNNANTQSTIYFGDTLVFSRGIWGNLNDWITENVDITDIIEDLGNGHVYIYIGTNDGAHITKIYHANLLVYDIL